MTHEKLNEAIELRGEIGKVEYFLENISGERVPEDIELYCPDDWKIFQETRRNALNKQLEELRKRFAEL